VVAAAWAYASSMLTFHQQVVKGASIGSHQNASATKVRRRSGQWTEEILTQEVRFSLPYPQLDSMMVAAMGTAVAVAAAARAAGARVRSIGEE